ncbi:hypothetical protein ACFFX0_20150 [Citricoccus parietis]|uniref:Uncharacterized protein n=1 Tax=Citricoccus parietis TaxID=592307 RepID=A0ABV5G406_9MICC
MNSHSSPDRTSFIGGAMAFRWLTTGFVATAIRPRRSNTGGCRGSEPSPRAKGSSRACRSRPTSRSRKGTRSSPVVDNRPPAMSRHTPAANSANTLCWMDSGTRWSGGAVLASAMKNLLSSGLV